MRILMLTHNRAWQSGTFLRAFSLAAEMVSLGCQVTLLAGRQTAGWTGESTINSGVRIVQPPDMLPTRIRHGGLSPLEVIARWRYASGHSFDVIHAFEHRPSVAWPALAARRRPGVVLIKDWADLWGFDGLAGNRTPLAKHMLGIWDQWGERASAGMADGVTVISQYLLALTRSLGVHDERICHVPVGANPYLIQMKPKLEARQAVALSADDAILVYMGFSHHDVDMIRAMMPVLVSTRPNVKLLLIGADLEQFTNQLRADGLGRHLIHVGQVPYAQLGDWLACGDLMLLPYADTVVNRARFPHRFGDYLAAGRPIVTNPTGDLEMLIESEDIGILVPDLALALAHAIDQLLDSPDRMQAMGKQARQLAEGRLSWRMLAHQVLDFYATVMRRMAISPKSITHRSAGEE